MADDFTLQAAARTPTTSSQVTNLDFITLLGGRFKSCCPRTLDTMTQVSRLGAAAIQNEFSSPIQRLPKSPGDAVVFAVVTGAAPHRA
ncbi:MAG: hypothetical protein M3R15_26555, partial [Acidobacteriota bacterium]|nr:hypothetical protein [Acidobacteriota bacterium]